LALKINKKKRLQIIGASFFNQAIKQD